MEKNMCEKDGNGTPNVPSLVDLCVQNAIDNVDCLGDVGETDIKLLERILPHCSVEELQYIEDSTQGRDLSPVTDKLWKHFYQTNFGEESYEEVVRRMNSTNVTYKWKELYEAKLKEVKEALQRLIEGVMRQYMNGSARAA